VIDVERAILWTTTPYHLKGIFWWWVVDRAILWTATKGGREAESVTSSRVIQCEPLERELEMKHTLASCGRSANANVRTRSVLDTGHSFDCNTIAVYPRLTNTAYLVWLALALSWIGIASVKLYAVHPRSALDMKWVREIFMFIDVVVMHMYLTDRVANIAARKQKNIEMPARI
jgi:hypothetical protein